MPKVSKENAGRFAALRRAAADALTKVNAARIEARQSGDTVREDQLRTLREQIRAEMQRIDEAEDAFERSSMSVSAAEAKLKGAVGGAKAAVAAMAGITDTLNKAAVILGILRGLVGLFA
jgi:hypothetical protein